MIELNKLKSANELKGIITRVLSPQQMLDLAEKKVIPHYVLTNPATGEISIWFTIWEVDEWFKGYFVKFNGIHNTEITIVNFDRFGMRVGPSDPIPVELTLINSLYRLPIQKMNTPPGIYFLCKGDQLKYIGKANNISDRVSTHRREMRIEFDIVYFICAHIDHLLQIESALIKHLKPPCNTQSVNEDCDDIDRIIIESYLKPRPEAVG